MNSKKKGLFISFEGPEASGKSTQIKLISRYLRTHKIKHIITREPGGTKISEKIRNIEYITTAAIIIKMNFLPKMDDFII